MRLCPEWCPLLRRFLYHKGPMALGAALGLLAVLAAVGLLALAGWFLTAAALAGLTAAGAAHFNFFLPSIGLRLFAFTRTLARYGERVYSHEATFRILESLRTWFFQRLEPLVPAVLSRYRSGDVLGRAVEDIDTLDNLYLRLLSPAAVATVTVMAAGAFLWWLDPTLALAAAAAWLPAGALPFLTARLGQASGAALARASADLRALTVGYLQGLTEIWIYDADRGDLDRVRSDAHTLTAAQGRMSHLKGWSAGMLHLLAGLASALILYVGTGRYDAGRIDGPQLVLGALAVLASFDAIWPLPVAFLYLARTREASRRLHELAGADPPVCFATHSTSPPESFSLTFEDVGFGYTSEAPPVLDRIDLHIAAGTHMAILGASGSGKSTLTHLVARFHDPDRGRILIGGRDLRSYGETDLRRWICVISQQPHIFNATLADNLRLAAPDAAPEQLADALAAAGLGRLTEALPQGPDTWLGEAGQRLSGGQVRRLAVARAFLRDAPVWILDEPTEGLDRITAHALRRTILQRAAGKTLLWITHRAAEAALLERVVLLDQGRVAAQGTHRDLLTSHPVYKDLISGGVLS